MNQFIAMANEKAINSGNYVDDGITWNSLNKMRRKYISTLVNNVWYDNNSSMYIIERYEVSQPSDV